MKFCLLYLLLVVPSTAFNLYSRDNFTEPSEDFPGLNSSCFDNVIDEYYVMDFLQRYINKLNDANTCWPGEGVSGLRKHLERNISMLPLLNFSVPTCAIPIHAGSNNFSLDLRGDSYSINGVSEDTVTILLFTHLALMVLAFFVVYPLILILSSAAVLCALIQKPLYQHKVHRWQSILQLTLFLPSMIGGLVTGVLAVGEAGHFENEHAISGLVTMILSAIAVILYLIQKHIPRPEFQTKFHKILNFVEMLNCQGILMVSSLALPTGIDRLVIVSLCKFGTISTSLIFSIGMGVAFAWNSAMMAMGLEWWLQRRANANEERETLLQRMSRLWSRESQPN